MHTNPDQPAAEPNSLPEDLVFPDDEERRTAPRLGGNPVAVLLSLRDDHSESFSGVVIDRSAGGLGLSLERGLRPGSALHIRAVYAPEDTPWIGIRVRSSFAVGPFWEVGCQFVEMPGPDLLQTFG